MVLVLGRLLNVGLVDGKTLANRIAYLTWRKKIDRVCWDIAPLLGGYIMPMTQQFR